MTEIEHQSDLAPIVVRFEMARFVAITHVYAMYGCRNCPKSRFEISITRLFTITLTKNYVSLIHHFNTQIMRYLAAMEV